MGQCVIAANQETGKCSGKI